MYINYKTQPEYDAVFIGEDELKEIYSKYELNSRMKKICDNYFKSGDFVPEISTFSCSQDEEVLEIIEEVVDEVKHFVDESDLKKKPYDSKYTLEHYEKLKIK